MVAFKAIATAGGYTRLASAAKITLQRQEQTGPRVLRVDAQAMARDQTTTPFQVLPDDVITVGERIF